MKIKQSLCSLLLLFMVGCSDQSPTQDHVALNDRGVAAMGRYEYTKAVETFTDVVKQSPAWMDARVNLSVATLNRQKEGDELAALEIAAEVLKEQPDHIRALYLSGIINLYLGRPEKAVAFLEAVTSVDDKDAYAAYFLGQSFLQLADNESAAQWFIKAIELDPYLRSAYWAGAQAYRRIDRIDESAKLLDDYQRFAPNPAAHLAGFSYTKMGPKANAQSFTTIDSLTAKLPEGALFAAPRRLHDQAAATATTTLTTAITAADIDGDQQLDFILTGDGRTVVISDSVSSASSDHPLRDSAQGAFIWGDVDDDGRIDLVICNDLGVHVRYQSDAGWQTPETLSSSTCSAGAMFDADHDGDLDILITGVNGSELLSNNRDGTFRDIAPDMGLDSMPGHQLLVADLDADRDLDIAVIGQVNGIWQNDRTWRYQPFPGLDDLRSTPLVAATVADTDADGHQEIYGIAPAGEVLVWRFDGTRWTRRVISGVLPTTVAELAIADFDGDGRPELLRSHPGGFVILDPRTDKVVLQQAVDNLQSAIVANIDPGRGPSVITVGTADVQLWPPGPGRYNFLGVSLSGRSESDQMRTNTSGIGTFASVRAGGRWTVDWVMDSHSGPGQSLMPLSIGLGGQSSADYIALAWSDGVSQTEIDLAGGELHVISETQRQLASCPVIFVWDGESYRFVSDVLGVGGMGFFTAPGESAAPRPFEGYLLDDNVMQPRDGRYHVKLTEPMEENAYLDAASIHVYELPEGWSMVLDERMGNGVTGRPITYRESVDPMRVTDASGAIVTPLVLRADLKAPDPGAEDHRFIGLLAEDQSLTVEFATAIDRAGATLVADGWVEYPYSQTVFAAWQAGIAYRSVTLAARDRQGQWHTVATEFGYPAGMPRKMALPLPSLPEGTTALRLSSNMEIYWDRLQVVYESEPDHFDHKVIKPEIARVTRPGFPKRTNVAQKVPMYDYEDRSPFWDTKFQRGFYTALGEATPLVADTDGAVAIIGGGEEIHLEFAALPPTSGDIKRYFVLDFRGWAKDMDLYTEHGETVGPIPTPDFVDKSKRDLLHARYNVRFQEGM